MQFNNSKIKILETIHQSKIGGGESHVLDLVTKLDKSKFKPIVLSFIEKPMVGCLTKMSIKTYVVNTLIQFNISNYKSVEINYA
jgi:hypothetical protein